MNKLTFTRGILSVSSSMGASQVTRAVIDNQVSFKEMRPLDKVFCYIGRAFISGAVGHAVSRYTENMFDDTVQKYNQLRSGKE